MELQEYFDKTVNYIRGQEEWSFDIAYKGCVYLKEDESRNKCAVGLHIPDGHPAQRYLGLVIDLSNAYPDLAGIAWPDSDEGLNLATHLQNLHDGIPNRITPGFGGLSAYGESAAMEIAETFNLTYTPPS